MPSLPGYILTMTSSVVLLTLVHLTRTSSMMGHYSDIQEYKSSNDPIGSKSTTSGPNPEFVSTETVVRVAPSQMAILPCSVRLLGERQVVWRRIKEDEFLTIGKMVWSKDPRVLVEYRVKEHGVTSWDLLLRNVQYNDAGIYECQVTSSEKLVWNVELKVIDLSTSKPKSRVHKQVTQTPHVTETIQTTTDHPRPARKQQTTSLGGFRYPIPDGQRTPHSEEFLTAGQPVRLMCNISLVNQSLPRATNIEWYKDGERVESNTQVLLTRYQLQFEQMYVSELTIDKSRLADSGIYFCRFMSTDLFLFRVFVLPNTTINSANKVDQSQYYAGDTLQKGNNAASSYSITCSWSLTLLYLIHALCVIHQLSVFMLKNIVSCCANMSTNLTQADPT